MSPRIASIECFIAAYPVVGDFRFLAAKDGKRITRNTVVVRLADDSGGVGWGQSVPSPTWSYETIETVQTSLERHLGPAILGLPVPAEIAARPAASAVILADRESDDFAFEGLADALALGDTDVRIFGKPGTRPYRRMGVALARAGDAPTAVDLAKQAAAAVRIVYSPASD